MSMSDFRGYICAGVWCLLFWGATSTNEIQQSYIREETACDKTDNTLRLNCHDRVILLLPNFSNLGRSRCDSNTDQQRMCCPESQDCLFNTKAKEKAHWKSLMNSCNNTHSCAINMTHTYMINEAAADCSGRKTDYETVSYRCVDDLHHEHQEILSTIGDVYTSEWTTTEKLNLSEMTKNETEINSEGSIGQDQKNPSAYELIIVFSYAGLVAAIMLLLPLVTVGVYLKHRGNRTAQSDNHMYEEIPVRVVASHKSSSGSSNDVISLGKGRQFSRVVHQTRAQPKLGADGTSPERVYHTVEGGQVDVPTEVIYDEPNFHVRSSAKGPVPKYEPLNQYSEAVVPRERYTTLVAARGATPNIVIANTNSIIDHTVLQENEVYSMNI